MKKIKAILVDDELKALESLRLKINKYFTEIEVIAAISEPEKAIKIINETQPDLVFIDIEMPVLSGFDVLSKIENPNFETIFVTAYNNYAIEAIQHCAIGYVVKPIDNDELKDAIKNAIANIKQKTALEKNTQLLEHLSINASQKSIAIPSQKGMSFIKLNAIIRFEGIDGYTKIHTKDEKPILSSYNIGKFTKMIANTNFFLCHKSHFINLNYVTSFLNEGTIELNNKDYVPCAKTKRNALLQLMQSL